MSCLHIFYRNDNEYKYKMDSFSYSLSALTLSPINCDQTGFLKNQFIRHLDSIVNYKNTEQFPGLFLFIDFEKAFDSVEWRFIKKILKYYNLGPSLIVWIKLFNTDISSCIQNNGWALKFFTLSHGVRQGCPLSPYLFILCAEIFR